MASLVNEVNDFLETQGLLPEYSPNKTRFRHPQRLSRIATISSTKRDRCSITFSQPLEEFANRWNLSLEGELPITLSLKTIKEVLLDFFSVIPATPPPGSPPFEDRLKEILEIITRYATRNQRISNYELEYEDLVQIALVKAYEVYLYFGDKPTKEFQCLIAKSIQHKFDSLLSKHYVSQCRAGAEVIGLTDELDQTLSEEPIYKINPTDWDTYLNKLKTNERVLLESVLRPPAALLRDNFLDALRYRRVKLQRPKGRIPLPRYKFNKIAIATCQSVMDLHQAYQTLASTIPTDAWNDLIEGP